MGFCLVGINTSMERRYDERLQTQTVEWMQPFQQHITHACTFTFKQYVGDTKITPAHAWKYWDNYCKYLNRLIYKHAAKNHGKSLLILPVLHGEMFGERLHFHAAIGCIDKSISFEKLKALINVAWRKMRWTLNETEVKPYEDAGWINYMLRQSVRLDLHSVDIERCCIPPALKS